MATTSSTTTSGSPSTSSTEATSTPTTSSTASPSAPTTPAAPSTPTTQIALTGLLNQTTESVTITAPPPPGVPAPVPIVVPAGLGLDLGVLPMQVPLIAPATPPVPPTPETAISVVVGTGSPVLLYTDGSGAAYLANATPGTTPAETLNRLSPPLECTLQVAPDATAGNITASGVVPIYTVTLV